MRASSRAGFPSVNGDAPILSSHSAAAPEAVAASLRLTVGSTLDVKDTISKGGVRIRIVGIYRPLGAHSAYAVLNQILDTGVRPAQPFFTFGPLDVDPSVFTSGLVTTNQTDWDIQPSPLVLRGNVGAARNHVLRLHREGQNIEQAVN